MDLTTMAGLISNAGFPIGITIIIIYALYKSFNVLCDKVLKPLMDRFFKSLDEVNESNKILVETNASFVGNVNTKMSVPFAYFLVESMNPLILVDFNKNAHVDSTSAQIKKRVADSIPLYSKEQLKDYKFSKLSGTFAPKTVKDAYSALSAKNTYAVLGTGNALVGSPFIYKVYDTKSLDYGQYRLGWKNPYN
jgi:hypothetical protein